MGKKRRIMTSGQKFVKKYRSFLEKAGDSAVGGDSIINISGMDPFISEAEITPHGNGEVSFRCFVENLSGANDDLKLKLDGVALFDAPIADSATAENITINGKNPSGKTALGAPAEVAALGALTDVTISNALLTAAEGQLVVSPGNHTLEVSVSKGGTATPKKSLTKKIKFHAPTPKVDLSAISISQGADGGADEGKIIFAVAGGDAALSHTKAEGSCSGERGFDLDGTAGAKNKLSVKLFVQAGGTGAFEAIATPGGGIPTAAASLVTSAGIDGLKTNNLNRNPGDVVRVEVTPCKKQAAGPGAPAADSENEAGKLTLLLTIT